MSGRCIAGKIYDGDLCGEWIRPVSKRPHQEISEDDRRFEDGTRAQLLDVIEIPFLEHKPATYQQENHLIDDSSYWLRRDRGTWNDLVSAVDDNVTELWTNGKSSYSGVNDRIALEAADELDSSLALIKPEELAIRVSTEGAEFGNNKRKVRARFKLKGHHYALAVTDPFIENSLLRMPNGDHYVEEAFICVSLGEPYEGYVYKLVASIITPKRAQLS